MAQTRRLSTSSSASSTSSSSMAVDAPGSKPTKRKNTHKGSKNDLDDDDDSEDDGTDTEMLDVSFDFFDPQPQDYHSIKLLLTQLLSHDAPLIDIGSITNLVLEQKLVGSTVKTDGAGADPYAVLSVLNLNVHKADPSIATLIQYILSKVSSTNPTFAQLLESTLKNSVESSTPTTPKHVGLVISERLVNMPAQVVPPMYRMLQEELQWARDDKEPYDFSHLLFLSRVFLSSAEQFEQDPNANINTSSSTTTAATTTSNGNKKGGKKGKKGNVDIGSKKARTGPGGKEARSVEEWMYHGEDEMIKKSSIHSQTFSYSTAPNREGDDPFGVETKGLVMLVEYGKFDSLVAGMEGFLGGMGGE